jgi:hypothetical protein
MVAYPDITRKWGYVGIASDLADAGAGQERHGAGLLMFGQHADVLSLAGRRPPGHGCRTKVNAGRQSSLGSL